MAGGRPWPCRDPGTFDGHVVHLGPPPCRMWLRMAAVLWSWEPADVGHRNRNNIRSAVDLTPRALCFEVEVVRARDLHLGDIERKLRA